MFNRAKVIRESLQTQQDFLKVVRDRHLMWAKNTNDPGATQTHVEIAELFRQSIEKYNSLLAIYNQIIE